MSIHFPIDEAKSKIGVKIKTLREFSGVPEGSTGIVTGMYRAFTYPVSRNDEYGLDITWDKVMFTDGFSKDEYYNFLVEIKE